MDGLQQCKTWVRNNSNLLNAIESGLSSLTWLLPDRFSDSELKLEALNSVLGLLGLFHESVLQEPAYHQDVAQPTKWPLWLGAVQQACLQLCWCVTLCFQKAYYLSMDKTLAGRGPGRDGCTNSRAQGHSQPVHPADIA